MPADAVVFQRHRSAICSASDLLNAAAIMAITASREIGTSVRADIAVDSAVDEGDDVVTPGSWCSTAGGGREVGTPGWADIALDSAVGGGEDTVATDSWCSTADGSVATAGGSFSSFRRSKNPLSSALGPGLFPPWRVRECQRRCTCGPLTNPPFRRCSTSGYLALPPW